MTPLRGETGRSLAGAVRLLGFRADGFTLLANDPGAAWRSFFSLVLTAPAFAIFLGSQRASMELEPAGPHFFVVWALIYLLLGFTFPLMLLLISERQHFAAKVPAFIAAANWASVPANYANLAGILAADAGLLPAGLREVVELGLKVWLLAVQWWLLRRVLGVGGGQAAALVLLSEVVSFALFLWGLTLTALPVASG